MHKLLARQLRRCSIGVEELVPSLADFVARVNEAYEHADDDRALFERSLDLASKELVAKNRELTAELLERRAAEKDLTLFRALIDRSNDAFEVVDPETARFLDVNDRACKDLGYTREEYLALKVFDVDPMVDTTIFEQNVELVRERGSLRWEAVHRRKDGSSFPVEVNIAHVRLEREYMVAVVRDMTERRRAEEERLRLNAAIEQATDSIIVTDADGNIRYVNPAFERASGYARNEVIGRNPRFLKSGKHEGSFYRALWAELSTKGTWSGNIINKTKAGELYEQQLSISRVVSEAGVVTSYVGVGRDLTAERTLQAQLRQAQKMEAVGRLAGGVAHDFNNALSTILSFGAFVRDALGPDSAARSDITEVLDAAQRAAALTHQLLSFSRRQIVQPRVLKPAAIVFGTEKMLRRLLGEHIDFVTLQDPDVGRVRMDPGQLEQILTNLAVNARDAMPSGGRLTIELRNATLTPGYTADHPGSRCGDYVLLAVSDTGQGMSEDVKAHAFEPFFTTKDFGKGTGLGLATCYGIVKQADGYISIDSEPGEGARFEVYLPRVAQEPEPARRLAAPRRGSETVLVVEDEPAVRTSIARLLRSFGYTVIEAETGSDALLVCERSEPIHLLLTDVVMPRMGGRELADRVAQARPGVQVVYMSGYTDDAIVHHGVLAPGLHFLHKPFSPETLAHKVREALDRDGPAQEEA